MSTGYQGCTRAVRRRLAQIRPDIVHGQGTERDCAMNAVFSGFPNVLTIHGNMHELARLFGARPGSYNWLAAKLENLALKRTAGVFCNSNYTEGLVRPRARRVWPVPNAVRAEFFEPPAQPQGPPKCILLNVGHPGPRKRQLELLDLILALRRQGLSFEFQFVGDIRPNTPYAAAFLERIKPMEREGFARCAGPKAIKELIRTFDAAAALVHFPTEEAFGLVAAEALARDLKLFAAGIGGIADIAAGVPGAELFGVEDFSGLTSAIARWIRLDYPRPAGAAQAMRDRYHPQLIALRHVEIYREVLRQS